MNSKFSRKTRIFDQKPDFLSKKSPFFSKILASLQPRSRKIVAQKCNKKLIFGVDYNRAKPPGPPDSISEPNLTKLKNKQCLTPEIRVHIFGQKSGVGGGSSPSFGKIPKITIKGGVGVTNSYHEKVENTEFFDYILLRCTHLRLIF